MIGRHRSELDTPALCIDLDLMEANIRAMSSLIAAEGKNWRPHIKGNKTPEIAQQMIEAGAIGVTSAKTSEAEVFMRAGITDILIANQIIGEQKLHRVVDMCQIGSPLVAIDHFVQAEALSDLCRLADVKCRVLVDLDVGMNRAGIRPGPDAFELAKGVDSLSHVELVGIMGYEGHLVRVEDQNKKETQIRNAMSLLEELRDRMLAAGMCCDIVSAGGTGTYQITATCPAITELQCGGGIFGDPFYQEQCQVTGLQEAIQLIATVTSRPCLERGVLDIGRKTTGVQYHPLKVTSTVEGRRLPDVQVMQSSAEHTTMKLGADSQSLVIGDRVITVPGYMDMTTMLHEKFYGLRNDLVEQVWEITARGKLQ